MNVTLSLDEKVVEEARKVARSMGKSLNQLVRDYLTRLAEAEDPERDVQELRRLSALGGGNSRGCKLDRDELHERT